MRFFNFYVAYMVQKYKNESAPIFYYVKSPKTNRKHQKIPYLQALTLGHIIKMTLYIHNFWLPGNLFHRIEPFTRLIDKTKVPSVPQCGSTWCGVEIVPRCELFTCRVPSSAQPSPSYQEYPRTARTESLLPIFPN